MGVLSPMICLVDSDDEFLDDNGDRSSFIDISADTAGDTLDVTNPFNNPDPVMAWRLANILDDAFLALLFLDLLDLESQEVHPQ